MKSNILIVDDSALLRRVECDIINSDNKLQATDTCKDGLEALEKLRTHKYDAVILDINMPIERSELEKLLKELVCKVDDGDQFVYMQVTRGSGLRQHIYAKDIKANL